MRFLTPREVTAIRNRALEILRSEPFPVLWEIASLLGMADALNSAEFRRVGNEMESAIERIKSKGIETDTD